MKLAFDIGIKNLAFCILNEKHVVALENCNLLEDSEVVHKTCTLCKLKASYHVQNAVYCKRHIPKTHKILNELQPNKKVSNKVLKELVKTYECEYVGATNEKCMESLSKKFALPLISQKATNASKVSLEVVHDALRKFGEEKWNLFSGCTAVLLENQPAFKNPHMKSVQVLLFAVLREQFLKHGQTPSYHFVHAKKKVVAQKGDAGYAERKYKSEERLKELFEKGQVENPEIYEAWKKSKKKSDMADALCMTVDYQK
jgi:hypothetical protein